MTTPREIKTCSSTRIAPRSSFPWYFTAVAFGFMKPSAVVSLIVTLLDQNGFLDAIPMIRVLRLFKMPHLVFCAVYLVSCFVVLPWVAEGID